MHITSIVQSYSYIRTTQRCCREASCMCEGLQTPGHCTMRCRFPNLALRPCQVFRSLRRAQVSVCQARGHAPVLRVSLGGVPAFHGTKSGRELDLFQGGHLKLAGFKTLSQAARRQEEEVVEVLCPRSCLCLPVPRACSCLTCGDNRCQCHDTLLVLRLLRFSSVVVTRRNSTLRPQTRCPDSS